MPKFHRHIFICINERDSADARGCCAAKGSVTIAEAFKDRLHRCGLKRIVRANKAGCLDQCALGPTVVVYPEGVWYGKVALSDVDEIVQSHILGGQPVQRLVIADERLTGKAWSGSRPAGGEKSE